MFGRWEVLEVLECSGIRILLVGRICRGRLGMWVRGLTSLLLSRLKHVEICFEKITKHVCRRDKLIFSPF